MLAFFGEECVYGLRSIELVRGNGPPGFPFGVLTVHGRIQLFDLPQPPWALPGSLRGVDRGSLEQAGATIEVPSGGLQTVIRWPGASLKEFFLFDVLMHEVAHHMIQQYRGKRSARVMRTRDHEAVAASFARWCRTEYPRTASEVRGAVRLTLTLIGDGIENLSNAVTLGHTAQMFGCRCVFKDWARLAETWPAEPASQELEIISASQVTSDYDQIVVVDTDGADDVYGFRLPQSDNPALVVGNERRGVSRDIRSKARFSVRIPTSSRIVSSLNVAAAGAIALFYLNHRKSGPTQRRSRPESRRPAVLMVGVSDHVELGSAIRSAAAFGWQSLLVEDRANVWFGPDRATRSEGRAAARRARNPIRVVPVPGRSTTCVRCGHRRHDDPGNTPRPCTARGRARPGRRLTRRALGGRRHGGLDPAARSVEFVQIPLPVSPFHYHYRLTASIALAEVARQVGLPMSSPDQNVVRRRPRYHASLSMEPDEQGEAVSADELLRL